MGGSKRDRAMDRDKPKPFVILMALKNYRKLLTTVLYLK